MAKPTDSKPVTGGSNPSPPAYPPIYIIWRAKDEGTFRSRVIYEDGIVKYQYRDSDNVWICMTKAIEANMHQDVYSWGMVIY